MASLFDLYAPIFSYVLDLEQKLRSNSLAVDALDEPRHELLLKIETAENEALESGKREADVKHASFATVAWADELIAAYPNADDYYAPLQVSLFNTANAGDEFFEHLAGLGPDQDEVREIFFTALGLGFVGCYYFDSGDNGELSRIKEVQGRQLPVDLVAIHTLPEEHLTPQPYLSDDPGPAVVPWEWEKLLLRIATAAALLIPLAILLYHLLLPLLTHQEPPPKPPPMVDMSAINQHLASFECAKLSARLAGVNIVEIQGHVATPDDRQRLTDTIGAMPHVEQLRNRVELMPWPYCEIIALLAPHTNTGATAIAGTSVMPHQHGPRFTDGEDIVLSLKGPNHDAYVYVDYYPIPGPDRSQTYVAHMLPNPLDAENLLAASASKVIGIRHPNERHWTVESPYGNELIVIMAFSHPLFDAQRPEVETAESYLAALKQKLRLERPSLGSINANHIFITTTRGRR